MHAIKKSIQAGFTLIEVMVVLVIIGITAAIVVPNIIRLPEKAKMSAAGASARSINTAVEMYKLENGNDPTSLSALVPKYTSNINDPWNKPFQFVDINGTIVIYTCSPDKKLITNLTDSEAAGIKTLPTCP